MQASQADIIKVTKHVIDPMKRHWNADFDAELIEDFVLDLKGIDENILSSAMRELRRESRNRPRLADIIKAVRSLLPKTESSEHKLHKGFHCMGHAEKTHPAKARHILESRAGQFALKLGIGRELLVAYEISGKEEFTEQECRQFKRDMDDTLLAISETKKANKDNNPLTNQLISMFESGMEREKELYAKFKKEAA